MDSKRSLRRFPALALSGVLALSPVLVGRVAHADPSAADRETARDLMNQGDRNFDAKDYAGALKDYQGAHSIMNLPSTGMGVAKSQAALGLLVEARDSAVLVSRMPVKPNEPPPLVKARAAAEKLARELSDRIPSVQIAVEGPGPSAEARVMLDGQVIAPTLLRLPRKTDPGHHVIRASAPGFAETSKDVTLREGEASNVTLTLQPSAPVAAVTPEPGPATGSPLETTPGPVAEPTSHPISPLVYAGFGVGAAGVIVGTVTGIMHLSKVSTVKKDYCHETTSCDDGYQAPLASADKFATISEVGFVVGAVGIGVGVVGLLLKPKSAEHASTEARAHAWWTPTVGVGSVGVLGGF